MSRLGRKDIMIIAGIVKLSYVSIYKEQKSGKEEKNIKHKKGKEKYSNVKKWVSFEKEK